MVGSSDVLIASTLTRPSLVHMRTSNARLRLLLYNILYNFWYRLYNSQSDRLIKLR